MIRKKITLMMLTILIAVCMSSTALAGTWLRDSRGWWYSNDDRSYKKNEWFMDANGKWYYFNASGYMSADEWIGNYYLGFDGTMLTNTITPDGFRVGSDGAWVRESESRAVLYDLYVGILSEIPDTEFALDDVNCDGILELITQTHVNLARSDIDVYRIQNGYVSSYISRDFVQNMVFAEGLPYIATKEATDSARKICLYNCLNGSLEMESEAGETEDTLSDWGNKALFLQIIRSGQELRFVVNNQANRNYYAVNGVSTGYSGKPDLSNSWYAWGYGF